MEDRDGGLGGDPATGVVQPAASVRPRHPRGGVVLSVIVAAGKPGPRLKSSVQRIRDATKGARTEIIVASNSEWHGAPPGVRVTTAGFSRGDRFDSAADLARGQYLAFVDAGSALGETWLAGALEIMANPEVGAAGGPLLPNPRVNRRRRIAAHLLRSRLVTGPRRYLFVRVSPRTVSEMPSTNLVVPRQVFRAVGGFQCPSPDGEATRLCYKIRSLLGLKVMYHPDLAAFTSPPEMLIPLLAMTANVGRHRGDTTRRLSEMTPRLSYLLPAVALVIGIVAILAAPFSEVARIMLAIAAAVYLAEALRITVTAGRFGEGAIAGLSLPLMLLAYGFGFWRGYIGKSLGEVSPGAGTQPPLRILVFNWRDVNHPWSGGAEMYIHQQAKRWVHAGHEVGWVSERFRSSKRVEVIDGIRFHRVGRGLWVYPLAALHYLLLLRARYDVIVDCENGIPFFTPMYTRKPVVLVVHHVHQEVFRRELGWYLRWLALWLEGSLMPRVYRNRPLVTVSRSTRDALLERGFKPERISIASNGVDLPEWDPKKRRATAPMLLYLGRLRPYKRVDVVLRAMPAVLERYPRAHLEIVGQGPDRDRLERLSWALGLAGSVRFRGYLSKRDRDRLLATAWVATCPSAFEGWGVVCMEASANGVPVVAADVTGLRDAVLDGVTGILVPGGDAEATAAAVVDLFGDPRKRQQMGVAGRAWAEQHGWDGSAEVFEEIISAAIRAHRVRPEPYQVEAEEPVVVRAS
jgi:glycosyltransferase involved in cell wall biosynthesis